MRLWYLSIMIAVLSACTPIHGDRPTWYEERWGEISPQQLDNSCGIASMATIMQYHFGDTRFDERILLKEYVEKASEEQLLKAMRTGVSLLELESLAQGVGYKTLRKMFTLEELEKTVSFVPVLVYLEIGKYRHFAVVRGMNKFTVWLADPARGNVYHSRDAFLKEWRIPEAYRAEWSHPGGLIIVRPDGEFALSLLREPISNFPASFRELRRQMMFAK